MNNLIASGSPMPSLRPSQRSVLKYPLMCIVCRYISTTMNGSIEFFSIN